MRNFFSLRLHSLFLIKTHGRLQSTHLTFASTLAQPSHNELEKYDCLGFDLDHTLCRYQLKPLFHLIYKTLANFLVEKHGYSNRLTHISEQDISFAQKGLVLDKLRGNFLKLDSDYCIIKGSHGTRFLSDSELLKIYGPNRVWEEARGIPSKLVLGNALNEPFYVFKDYFVTPGAVICAKMVDIIDEERGAPGKEGYRFWDQYIEGVLYMYERDNFRTGGGCFFPELVRNPHLYLRPTPRGVKEWLAEIRRQKVTFLLTSANFDAAHFIASYCLGADWQKNFHLVVTFARKPAFFLRRRPFLLVDEGGAEGGEEEGSALAEDRVYSQGNYEDLRRAVAALARTDAPRTLYFGDSLIEDVYATSEVTGCDTAAVVEELLLDGEKPWGSFFGEGRSLWARLLREHARFTLPSMEACVQAGCS